VRPVDHVGSEGRLFGYRNYLKRCRYLAHRFEIGKLESVCLARYSLVVLKRMLRQLNLVTPAEAGMSAQARRAVLEYLRKFLKTRTQTLRNKDTSPAVVVLNWTSKLLRHVPLRVIMCRHRKLLPENARECVDNVVVARRLAPPIGRMIFNYGPVARAANEEMVAGEPSECPCRSLFAAKYRPNGGCVVTGDLDIVAHTELRSLLSFGPRFRLRVIASPYQQVQEALHAFVLKQNLHESQFAEWEHAVLQDCKAQLKKGCASVFSRQERTVDMSNSAAKYLKFLQNHLVLVPADKAANNVAFVCKRHYCAELLNEFKASGAYVNAETTPEAVILEHTEFLATQQLPADDSLPYLYWLPKLHKVPVGKRFIAGSAACSTTELSKLLSAVLTLVLQTLRNKDNEHIAQTEVRRFFVVSGYEEVAAFLHRFPRSDTAEEDRVLCTGDFSTMYTTIPHADLMERIRGCLDEAWEYQSEKEKTNKKNLFVQWSLTSPQAEWTTKRARKGVVGESHSAHSHTMSLDTIDGLVRFLVANTYLVNGGQLRRQVVGIPMGTNCAPSLANLYLYSYECEFIDRVMATHGAEFAKSFHESYRFIDDTLSVHNPNWREYVRFTADEGGIYPRELTLNDTTISSDCVHFLGMEIVARNGKLVVDVFDKRKEFPFAVRRYPHMCSLIPRSIPYGVFTGQLYRFSRICSHAHAFVRNALFVAQTLCAQGCSKHVLRLKFHAFASAHAVDRWNMSVRALCGLFNRGLGR
jgi:hypothetical protein